MKIYRVRFQIDNGCNGCGEVYAASAKEARRLLREINRPDGSMDGYCDAGGEIGTIDVQPTRRGIIAALNEATHPLSHP